MIGESILGSFPLGTLEPLHQVFDLHMLCQWNDRLLMIVSFESSGFLTM